MTMLTHPNEEVLQRFRHGELVAHQMHDCDEHVALCLLCRERTASLARDEDQVLALLRSLDEPVAPVHVATVVARAKTQTHNGWYRLAASLLLTGTALGAAYAMPGSPLKKWIGFLAARVTREAPAARQSEESPAGTPQATSGIAVVPGARFVIRFDAPAPNGEAFVSFTDDSTLSVRAAQGSATFTSEAGRLLVEPRGSDVAVEIEIPRLAPRIEIQVAGERVFLKEGTRVITTQASSGEHYRIPLTNNPR